MKRKLSLLVAGMLVGAAFMAFVPANAHHSGNFRSLSRRATNLERQVAALQRQVRTLNSKTQLMDAQGFYDGLINSQQVVGVCAARSPATWEQVPQVAQARWIDNCAPASSFRTQFSQRDIRRFTQR